MGPLSLSGTSVSGNLPPTVPGKSPTPAASAFSPVRILAPLIQGPANPPVGQSLRQIYSRHPFPTQKEMQNRLGQTHLETLFSLSEEGDASLFFQGLLVLGRTLELEEKWDLAVEVYRLVGTEAEGFPKERHGARSRLDAMEGKGSFGLRCEFLLRRFAKESTDFRTILPMMGASLVSGLVEAVSLTRMAGLPASWYNRGRFATGMAAAFGFMAEVPAFAAMQRGLASGSSSTFSEDLKRSALSLGAFKGFGILGHRISHGLKASPPFRVAIHQASLLGGTLVAHRLEEKMGLRAPVAGATTLLDAVSSVLTLSVGSHLGRRALPGIEKISFDVQQVKQNLGAGAISIPMNLSLASDPLLGRRWSLMVGESESGGYSGSRQAGNFRFSESRKVVHRNTGLVLRIELRSQEKIQGVEAVAAKLSDAVLDILFDGEESGGFQLAGELARKLRADAKLRRELVTGQKEVEIEFDATKREILRIQVEGKNRLHAAWTEASVTIPLERSAEKVVVLEAAPTPSPPDSTLLIPAELASPSILESKFPKKYEEWKASATRHIESLETKGNDWVKAHSLARRLMGDTRAAQDYLHIFVRVLEKHDQGETPQGFLELLNSFEQILPGKPDWSTLIKRMKAPPSGVNATPSIENSVKKSKNTPPQSLAFREDPNSRDLAALSGLAVSLPELVPLHMRLRVMYELAQATKSAKPTELAVKENFALGHLIGTVLETAPRVHPAHLTRLVEIFEKGRASQEWEQLDVLLERFTELSSNPAALRELLRPSSASEPPVEATPIPVETPPLPDPVVLENSLTGRQRLILNLISRHPEGLHWTGIAERTGLPRRTVLSVLKTLSDPARGFLLKNTDWYPNAKGPLDLYLLSPLGQRQMENLENMKVASPLEPSEVETGPEPSPTQTQPETVFPEIAREPAPEPIEPENLSPTPTVVDPIVGDMSGDRQKFPNERFSGAQLLWSSLRVSHSLAFGEVGKLYGRRWRRALPNQDHASEIHGGTPGNAMAVAPRGSGLNWHRYGSSFQDGKFYLPRHLEGQGSQAPTFEFRPGPTWRALKRLAMLDQNHFYWGGVRAKAQNLYQALHVEQRSKDTLEWRHADDYLREALHYITTEIEAGKGLGPRQAMEYLRVYEQALSGEVSWKVFENWEPGKRFEDLVFEDLVAETKRARPQESLISGEPAPAPPTAVQAIRVTPAAVEGQGLFGLASSFPFFSRSKGNLEGAKAFEATLVFPDLRRITLPLLVDSSGTIRVHSGESASVQYHSGKEREIRVSPIENSKSRILVNLQDGTAPLELNLVPVLGRPGSVIRLELAPRQDAAIAGLDRYFSRTPLAHRPVQALHAEQISESPVRGGGGKHTYSLYLSNGDMMDLEFFVDARGKGRFSLETATLLRLGASAEESQRLEVKRGNGSGGKNRIVIKDADSGYHLEIDCDTPRDGRKGAVEFHLEGAEIKQSPRPRWLALDQAKSEEVNLDEPSEEQGDSSAKIRKWSGQFLSDGDLGALELLSQAAQKNPQAVQELVDLFEWSLAEGAESFGNIPAQEAKKILREALAPMARVNSQVGMILRTTDAPLAAELSGETILAPKPLVKENETSPVIFKPILKVVSLEMAPAKNVLLEAPSSNSLPVPGKVENPPSSFSIALSMQKITENISAIHEQANMQRIREVFSTLESSSYKNLENTQRLLVLESCLNVYIQRVPQEFVDNLAEECMKDILTKVKNDSGPRKVLASILKVTLLFPHLKDSTRASIRKTIAPLYRKVSISRGIAIQEYFDTHDAKLKKI